MTLPARPHSPLVLVLVPVVLGIGLLASGCGDDGSSGGSDGGDPGAPVSSPPLDGTGPDQGTMVPEFPANDDPSAVTCTAPPKGVFDATAIVGEALAKATAAAEAEGCSVRVVIEDGKPLAVTQDFRPDRVNVAVEDDTVKRIVDLG